MARHRCNFNELERKALFALYEIVKDINQKVDYVIESQREYYITARPGEDDGRSR